MDRRAEVTQEDRIRLYAEGQVIYELNPAEMLWYSTVRPWQLSPRNWKRVPDADSGALRFQDGSVRASIRFHIRGEELSLTLVFENTGRTPLYAFSGGITLPLEKSDRQKVTVPHMIYNDNPSAAPDRIVPHIGTEPGKGLVVEEHRLPIPAVNVEWKEHGAYPWVTLLSVPRIERGEDEEYWSLGVLKETAGCRILSASGVLMFNGRKDVYYGGRCTPLSYLGGYRVLRPGERLEKQYFIGWGRCEQEGRGFLSLTDMAYRLLAPRAKAQHSTEEMIAYKRAVLDSRYYETETCAGYLTFGSCNSFGNISGRPEYFLYGWTGQAIRLAWCDCMLGLRTKETWRLKRGMGVVDFFLRRAQTAAVPGLFAGYYMIEPDQFRGAWNSAAADLPSRIQGESIADCLEVMLLLSKNGVSVPKEWESTVKDALAFLTDTASQTKEGLYPLAWSLQGEPRGEEVNAAGMPCVLALALAGEYFGEQVWLEAAKERYGRYASYHMDTFEIPFAHATMDARCEDKEAGIYFFTAAAKLYELTGEECFLTWGKLAADWILTFVYHWNTGFRPGTDCAQHGFESVGWPGVSVQNHHLDVFFPTWELYRFGRLCGSERFQQMALNVSHALTWGLATKKGEWGYTVVGEQGEQYYQTNYFQVRYPLILDYLGKYRGGMQVWNPSWITAQVLSSALKFRYWEELS